MLPSHQLVCKPRRTALAQAVALLRAVEFGPGWRRPFSTTSYTTSAPDPFRSPRPNWLQEGVESGKCRTFLSLLGNTNQKNDSQRGEDGSKALRLRHYVGKAGLVPARS